MMQKAFATFFPLSRATTGRAALWGKCPKALEHLPPLGGVDWSVVDLRPFLDEHGTVRGLQAKAHSCVIASSRREGSNPELPACGLWIASSVAPSRDDGGEKDLPSRPSSPIDRKSTRLNSSHVKTSYAVSCLKKKKKQVTGTDVR